MLPFGVAAPIFTPAFILSVCVSSVTQSCPTLCDPTDCRLPWNSLGQNTGVGILYPLQGIKPRSHTLQADSLPAEPQGKPRNTVVGSLSLFQGIFLTHGSPIWRRKWKPTPVFLPGEPMDGRAWQATVRGLTKTTK